MTTDVSPTPETLQPAAAGQQHEKTPGRLFGLLILLHLTVWPLLTAAARPNPPLDMVEMLFWGHEWQLGYTKHPPLPSWACEAMALVAGPSVWAQYLLGHLAVAVAFWAVWRLAREIVSPWLALLSVCLLECFPFYTFECEPLNNNIGLFPCWTLTILCLYWALTTGRLRSWLGVGLWLGLGMLTKYSTATLALTILAFGVLHPQARRAWRGPGPLLAILVSVLVFLPHLLWLQRNGFGPLRYVTWHVGTSDLAAGPFWDPLTFVAYQLLALMPLMLALSPLVGLRWRFRPLEPTERLPLALLAAAIFGPLLLHLIADMSPHFHLQFNYGSPFWPFFGLWLIACLRHRRSPAWRKTWKAWAVAAGVMLAVGLARPVLEPHFHHRHNRCRFPGRVLAEKVNEIWNQRFDRPLAIVAGDYFAAGNVGLFSPQRPHVYQSWQGHGTDLRMNPCPWLSEEELLRSGGVIVWNRDDPEYKDGLAADVAKRLGVTETIALAPLPFQTTTDFPPLRAMVAIIPPHAPPRLIRAE
jgi:hypothetical protein